MPEGMSGEAVNHPSWGFALIHISWAILGKKGEIKSLMKCEIIVKREQGDRHLFLNAHLHPWQEGLLSCSI